MLLSCFCSSHIFTTIHNISQNPQLKVQIYIYFRFLHQLCFCLALFILKNMEKILFEQLPRNKCITVRGREKQFQFQKHMLDCVSLGLLSLCLKCHFYATLSKSLQKVKKHAFASAAWYFYGQTQVLGGSGRPA